MTDAHTDNVSEMEMKKRKADALFAEIKRIVGSWRASEGSGWGLEEWKDVKEICAAVDKHGMSRYGY